jgi:hypothetical protein
MRLSWLPTPRNSAASSTQPEAANQPPHGRLKRVFWFVALWCVGVAGAMLLALPFRLLMRAAMH